MSRSIIVLSDGTGNSAASTNKTNVWRIYEALDLTAEDQIASFDDGVGTSSFKPLQYLGLALGIGVKRNVLELYKFICRNYDQGDPAAGKQPDRIYAFGFSRGAFTVRVLNGLIGSKGLAYHISDEQLQHDAIAAYRAFRAEAFPSNWRVRLLRGVRDWCVRGIDGLTGTQGPRYRTGIRVHFIGIWDTVAAYGLPIDELTRAVDRWVWPMRFENTDLPPHVDWARHALGLDDERRTFFPIPWRERKTARTYGESLNDQALLQVWFAGVHANIGGGYADDRLAHVSLNWMIEEAGRSNDALRRVGLRFKPTLVERYRAFASPHGRKYDSRSGLGTFYRYHPRSLADLMKFGNVANAAIDSVPLIHDSVILRMAEGSDHYASVAIDTDIDVLTDDDMPIPFHRTEPGGTLRAAHVARAINQLIDGSARDERDVCLRRSLDCVWWRRVLYYLMLSLAVVLAAFPLLSYEPGSERDPVASYLDWIADLSTGLADNVTGFILSPIFFAVRMAGLGQVGPWIDAYEVRPFIAGLLMLLFVWVYRTSGVLQVRIHDWASAAWSGEHRKRMNELDALESRGQARSRKSYKVSAIVVAAVVAICLVLWPQLTMRSVNFALGAGIFILSLSGLALGILVVLFFLGFLAVAISQVAGRRTAPAVMPRTPRAAMPQWRLLRLARRCREATRLVEAYQMIKFPILPFMSLLLVFALLLWLPAARAIYAVSVRTGYFCHATSDTLPVTGVVSKSFAIRDRCWASGVRLEAGRTYRVTLRIPIDADWFDKTDHADVAGFPSRDVFRRLTAITKRHWAQNWFRPIVRIGASGMTEYAMEPTEPPPKEVALNPKAERDLQDVWDSDPNRSSRLLPIAPGSAKAATAIYAKAGIPVRRIAQVAIQATRSGELFVYVNDSLPIWPFEFYANNYGTAEITITPQP